MTLAELKGLVEFMREFRIQRLKYEGVEVDLREGGAAPAQVGTAEKSSEEAPCPCGHALMYEHNEQGCLHGCSVALCISAESLEA